MDRDSKIDALVNEMDNWDINAIKEWAKDTRREMLFKAPDDSLDEEYQQLNNA